MYKELKRSNLNIFHIKMMYIVHIKALTEERKQTIAFGQSFFEVDLQQC